MKTYVLVHGMWHGGWCWDKVAPLLRAAGHDVYTPTLTGLGERADIRADHVDLHTHLSDIASVFTSNDIHDAVLVGHSFGGTFVPAVAEQMPERIAYLVNLDGPIAEDGQALKDTIGDTWDFFLQSAVLPEDPWRIQPVPSWTFGVSGADLEWMQSKLRPQPIRTLTTPLELRNPAAGDIPRLFLSCTGDAPADELAAEASRYAQLGYRYQSLPTGHDAMITMPEALAEILLGLG